MKPSEISAWLERLGLSVTEGGEALNLSHPHATMGAYLSETNSKAPAAPTVLAMEAVEAIANALVCLRTGRTDEARKFLENVITPAIKRVVRERAPGAEAIGPRQEPSPPPADHDNVRTGF